MVNGSPSLCFPGPCKSLARDPSLKSREQMHGYACIVARKARRQAKELQYLSVERPLDMCLRTCGLLKSQVSRHSSLDVLDVKMEDDDSTYSKT